MTELENDILRYFRRAAHPGRQIAIIADLICRDVEYVIVVLKRYRKIPQDVTKKNYRRLNLERLKGGLSDDQRRYVLSSLKASGTVAQELQIPVEEVLELRREAAKKAKRNGGRKKNER